MSETTKRILYLLSISGQNAHQVEVGADLPNATINRLQTGKIQNPSAEAIVKLARYFNVSADYLLCLTDEPKPLENREIGQVLPSAPAIVGQMPDLFNEQRFVNTAKIYNELPDEYRERAFGLIVGIAVGLGINVENILRR